MFDSQRSNSLSRLPLIFRNAANFSKIHGQNHQSRQSPIFNF